MKKPEKFCQKITALRMRVKMHDLLQWEQGQTQRSQA
ncbi:rCG61127 [Rattus norvegicus]|uniref:RCG61127 n=1 Tax=Rattus norvegicus TaxID=10116 RepID=A6KEE0_RAT|nr:rCG61127 [Rattus norvegicus]